MAIESFSFFDTLKLSFVLITLFVTTRLIIYLLKRMWQKNKCKLVWTSIDFVERRSNLSCDEFVQKYASVGKPVIITDMMQDWKAMKKWTLDFFKSHYGSIEYVVKNNKNEDRAFMTIADYIDYMSLNDREECLYLANWVVSYYPELLEDYKEPIYFSNWFQRLPRKLLQKYEYDNPEIFIGYKGTSVGLHKDPTSCAAWLGLISGRKKIIFFTPEQKDVLYEGKVDAFNPNLEKFPLYAKAKPVEVTLEPGEIIYIPPNWWHQVKNLENSIGMGNIFVNESNSELVFQSFLEKSPIKGYLIPLILEFPWLSRFLLAVGLL
ncbi:MAG: cupin-like domain-containing protein [Nostoc sp.]|uniref:cupin-like domain-containing protein n=1 Tax=Nostoc sp. TaxID=1180 RepID=UPI002FF833A6